ncbi:hypothetical protein ACWXVO_03130 [Mycoplasma sp. 1890]
MNFKINWKQAFKQDLYDQITRELPNMNGEAEWDLYINNEEYFKKEYDENMEMEMFYLKDINDYKTDELIFIGKEILERNGEPYSIIKWHKGELIFEGYENQRHGDYLRRKRELNI